MQQRPVTIYLCDEQEIAYRHVIAEARKRTPNNPIPPITILTPSVKAERFIRSIQNNSINTTVQQFYSLAQSTLKRSRSSVHEIKDIAIRRLVRRILIQTQKEDKLTSFEPIHLLPGFNRVIVSWLREVKSLGIDPELALEQANVSDNERDKQLATIYNRYQQYLQQQKMSDADGLLWLAAEALEDEQFAFGREDDEQLFVFGFDQFTPIQLRILRALSRRFRHTFITLAWDPNRDADSLALTRFAETRRNLNSALHIVEESIPVEPDPTNKSPALRYLAQTLFEDKSNVRPPQDIASINALEAPSREDEVRSVLRTIKKLILDDISPADIQILLPNPEPYSKLVHAIAINYGLPVSISSNLRDNPAVIALLELLSLHSLNFPRRATLNTLRSPYFRQKWLTPEDVNLLEQLTLERPVIAGKPQWKAALRPVISESSADDAEHVRLKVASALEAEVLVGIQKGLLAFFDQITPDSVASYEVYALWIQEAIIGLWDDVDDPQQAEYSTVEAIGLEDIEERLSLMMLDCINSHTDVDPMYAENDLQALNILLRKIREIVVSANTIPLDSDIPGSDSNAAEGQTGERRIKWGDFESDLQNVLPNTKISSDPDLVAVQMDPLSAIRSIATEYVFVMGLSEGEFPALPQPDVFYTAEEREKSPLGLRKHRSGDDASLWWQVVGSCKQKLFLSRPWLDSGGAEWSPSPYWDEVMECLPTLKKKIVRMKISAPILPGNAASKAELFLALIQQNSALLPAEFEAQHMKAMRTSAIMLQRQSWKQPDKFEGILRSADIVDELADRYGPTHIWSASRLNRFNNCPYGFFIEHILRINILEEPEEGLNARQRGSLLHAILEDLHKDLHQNGMGLSLQYQEGILDLLEQCSKVVFKNAPLRFGFLSSPLWPYEQEELKRLLRALIRWECEDAGDDASYLPYKQELSFGIGGDGPPAMEVIDENGLLWKMRGFIDRVDRSVNERLRIIDYKSGSSIYSGSDIEKGLAFQSPLYLYALEQILQDPSCKPHESYYLHIPTRESSGIINVDDTSTKSKLKGRDLIDASIDKATATIAHVRSGNFPNAPAKQDSRSSGCASWCQLSSICQITRQSLRKGRSLLQEGGAP